MIVPQITKQAPKISEELPVFLPVTILETQNNMEDRGRMDSMVKLKKTVIHQCQIPGQN